VHQARFASSGGAQQGHGLPRLGGKADPFQNCITAIPIVAEGDIFKSHPAAQRQFRACLRTVLHPGLFFQHLLDAPCQPPITGPCTDLTSCYNVAVQQTQTLTLSKEKNEYTDHRESSQDHLRSHHTWRSGHCLRRGAQLADSHSSEQ
jgi:hypothetical protein